MPSPRRPHVNPRKLDSAEHLRTHGGAAAHLEAALVETDAALVARALGEIARARGMTEVSRMSGLGRESLYKALSPDGNPEFATILKVMQALGLRLEVRCEQ